LRSVSYVQVNGVPPSSLFHHVALVRTEFTTFCSQIRSQHSKRTTLGASRRCVKAIMTEIDHSLASGGDDGPAATASISESGVSL
jgi:hypothetical protein